MTIIQVPSRLYQVRRRWVDAFLFAMQATALLVLALPSQAAPDCSTLMYGCADRQTSSSREIIRTIINREVAKTSLPADVAEAVVFVESGYNAAVVGRVGEIGLMQLRPETARMLGFRGTPSELADPDINIHYGVIYLSEAWRLANGDLCQTLMKYRAGHGEKTMSPRSQVYCDRARSKLLAMNALQVQTSPVIVSQSAPQLRPSPVKRVSLDPKEIYKTFKQGTSEASSAYWKAHEARISEIKSRINNYNKTNLSLRGR